MVGRAVGRVVFFFSSFFRGRLWSQVCVVAALSRKRARDKLTANGVVLSFLRVPVTRERQDVRLECKPCMFFLLSVVWLSVLLFFLFASLRVVFFFSLLSDNYYIFQVK